MSQLPLCPPLRPAGPACVDVSRRRQESRTGLTQLQPPVEVFTSPKVTLHFQSRASILSLSPAVRRSGESHSADGGTIVHPVVRFLVTSFMALLALASAVVVAFGTHPNLARYPQGLDYITLARRWQWPLTSLCLMICVALIAMVIGGKRRAPWLLILAPVCFLFYQRFTGDPFRKMTILDNPTFGTPDKVGFLKSDSPVIGLVFEGQPYAYPCGSLALAPVVAHADADHRLLLMYSPYAGRAQAFVVDATVKPRRARHRLHARQRAAPLQLAHRAVHQRLHRPVPER